MIKFLTGQTASEANQALKSSLQTMEKAKHCSVLWFEEINERKLFRELGYVSINQYAGQESLLPLQPNRRPSAMVPVNVALQMSPIQFARYEALWEKIRKQRHAPADKVEALLEMMETYVAAGSEPADDSSPRGDAGPSTQVHVHFCLECEKATTRTSKGELDIGQKELERIRCDCRISRPNERNTTSIPSSVRRLVFVRARHQCQHPGCSHTRYLEIHHVIPRSRGGDNDPENCICLCSAHHALVHKQQMGQPAFWVKSSQIQYKWG